MPSKARFFAEAEQRVVPPIVAESSTAAPSTAEVATEPRRQKPAARKASTGSKSGRRPSTVTPVKAGCRVKASAALVTAPPQETLVEAPPQETPVRTPAIKPATPLQVETWRTPAEPSLTTPPAPPPPAPPPPAAMPPPPAPPPPAPPWHHSADAPALPPGYGPGRGMDPGSSGSLLISALRCNALPSPTRAGHGVSQGGRRMAPCSALADCVTTDAAACMGMATYSPVQAKRLACDLLNSPAVEDKRMACDLLASPACPGIQVFDEETGRPSSISVDQALAMALQATASEASTKTPGSQFSLHSPTAQSVSSSQSDRRLSDPVWGEVEFVGASPSGSERLFYNCCPCLVIGCGGKMRCSTRNQLPIDPESARRAWKRFLFSFATAISALQVVALICVLVLGKGFVPVSRNMMWGPHPYYLDVAGAKNVARILILGEWWRILTPLLLHSGVLHLGANILVQIRLGVALEVLWGHRKFLQIYLLSGTYSVVASSLFLPGTISVGSSGAICGLVGAEIVFIILTWRQTLPKDIPDRNTQMASFFLTVMVTGGLSFLPMVDFAAHAGGFVAGVLLALVLFADRMEDCSRRVHAAVHAFSLIVLGLLVCGSIAYLAFRIEPDRALLHVCQPTDC
mmetsp:Transcript_66688/g.121634  ORF Transcript_66688/g.121634 Transcript_66688/m.121634 type:complete len:630 (-) Transcript_66688:91-1980(-)